MFDNGNKYDTKTKRLMDAIKRSGVADPKHQICKYENDHNKQNYMSSKFEIREYTESNNSPFADWFNSLDAVTAARIDKYIRRLEAGNFGAAKYLNEGVFELKMDFGPGYRVYYGRDGKTIIILLGGGSKRRQAADIAAAIERWKRYKETKKDNGPDS